MIGVTKNDIFATQCLNVAPSSLSPAVQSESKKLEHVCRSGVRIEANTRERRAWRDSAHIEVRLLKQSVSKGLSLILAYVSMLEYYFCSRSYLMSPADRR